MAAIVPLTAYKRAPFVEDDGCTIAILGPDFTGATFAMHLRNRKGDAGAPLISLVNAAAGSQGISASYDANYNYNENGDEAPASKVLIQIDEATLEGLATSNRAEIPLILYYDLHVTPPGLPKRVIAEGEFTILPGVTI